MSRPLRFVHTNVKKSSTKILSRFNDGAGASNALAPSNLDGENYQNTNIDYFKTCTEKTLEEYKLDFGDTHVLYIAIGMIAALCYFSYDYLDSKFVYNMVREFVMNHW